MDSPREYLDGLAMHGIKLGLRNIEQLLAVAEHPERSYPTVHIAGTNGKGSVVALLHAMLQHAGYRVGRFTSPHLIDLRERFQINGECINETAMEENIRFFQQAAADFEHPPTFFELNTAVAFRWFAQQRVDLALVEVGMGGRLDSTNVISPIACAITNIDLEHTQYLGTTLAEIAAEKAGVIKFGVPVITGERHPEALSVIAATAAGREAPLRRLGEEFSYDLKGEIWEQRLSYASPTLQLGETALGLAGPHQGANAAVAIAVAESCQGQFPRLDTAAITAGLATVRWPGRLERVLEAPPVIMDAAHNAAGTRRLAETVGTCVVVLAVAGDKDAGAMVEALAPIASPLILTQFSGDRALSVEHLSAAAGACPHQTIPRLSDAIAQGMAIATPEKPLLITGSLYLVGEARQVLMAEYGARPLQF